MIGADSACSVPSFSPAVHELHVRRRELLQHRVHRFRLRLLRIRLDDLLDLLARRQHARHFHVQPEPDRVHRLQVQRVRDGHRQFAVLVLQRDDLVLLHHRFRHHLHHRRVDGGGIEGHELHVKLQGQRLGHIVFGAGGGRDENLAQAAAAAALALQGVAQVLVGDLAPFLQDLADLLTRPEHGHLVEDTQPSPCPAPSPARRSNPDAIGLQDTRFPGFRPTCGRHAGCDRPPRPAIKSARPPIVKPNT